MKKRVLSGIRATGLLHLGNYLGGVKGMLELQNDNETFYMVADGHTLTTPFDVEELRSHRREVMIDYLSCGLDPEKSVLFMQSMVPQHFELAFYFSSVVSIARMQHLPTFKEKVKQYPESATMALLNYPILMAADILVYKATHVPVGIDQEPHLEIAREIARKCNSEYGTKLPEPVRFATKGAYVPSLQGEGKMSKSVSGSYIGLRFSLEEIQKALAAAPTDSGKGEVIIKDDVKHPRAYINDSGSESFGVASLLQFVELFEGAEKRKHYDELYTSSGIRYKDLKAELAQAIFAELAPIQQKRKELESNKTYVDDVIAQGAHKAQIVAGQTLAEVKDAIGLGK